MAKLFSVVAYAYTFLVVIASLGKIASLGVFPENVKHSDKIGHFIAYAGFAFVWGFFFVKSKKYNLKKSIGLSLLWSVFFGVLMECCQWFFTNYRQFDYYDMLANTFGAVLGLLLFGIIFVFTKKDNLRFLK